MKPIVHFYFSIRQVSRTMTPNECKRCSVSAACVNRQLFANTFAIIILTGEKFGGKWQKLKIYKYYEISSPYLVVLMAVFANSCLITHQADTEEHKHLFRVPLQNFRLEKTKNYLKNGTISGSRCATLCCRMTIN